MNMEQKDMLCRLKEDRSHQSLSSDNADKALVTSDRPAALPIRKRGTWKDRDWSGM